MEEKTIEVVVDEVTIPLEEEEKEFLKRRFSRAANSFICDVGSIVGVVEVQTLLK